LSREDARSFTWTPCRPGDGDAREEGRCESGGGLLRSVYGDVVLGQSAARLFSPARSFASVSRM
jgi:hypothetical protein